jgi:intergrase/recombinase
LKNHSKSYSHELARYVSKYGHVLKNPSKVSEITGLPIDVRRNVMAGLSNFAKYLGMYPEWKAIKQNSALKWEKKPTLDIVLDILNSPLRDTLDWLKQVLQRLPRDYATVMVFNALSGLRVGEGINACRLLSDLSERGKMETYLNKELMMLEHFRFRDIFLRKSKNAYISFVTPELLDLVTKTKPRILYETLDTKIDRMGLPNRSRELRKYFATTLRDSLPSEAVDLLQGRVSSSVFAKNY